MSVHKTLLPLFSALVLSGMVAGQANADFLSYAAKFNCGNENLNDLRLTPEVVAGVYLTSINIHNPNLFDVVFTKKFVLAVQEPGAPGAPLKSRIVKLPPETLGADSAEFVDCSVIYSELGVRPPAVPPIEGFVVIETASTGENLDVVGKYTARGSVIGTFFPTPALEIVVYPATVIKVSIVSPTR
jgi:hypothetical protein